MFLKDQNLTVYDTILNKDIYWFIKNNIIINSSNFMISTDDNRKYNNSYSFFYDSVDIFFFHYLS